MTRSKTAAILFAGASFIAISTSHAADVGETLETIVVTGSRIRTDGFESPTPVTVAPASVLLQAAPANLADALNQLPQFLGSTDPSHGRKLGPQTPHGNFLNLRDVGANRTLIMLDNVRVPPTTYVGTVNVDIIPQLLIERVEIVTSGASSAYGSDAVAGVVNYILDRDLVGVKGLAQAGLSTHGDAFNYRVGAAGGFALGDRGHVLLSAERFYSEGILMADRPKISTNHIAAGRTVGGGTAGTAANPFVFYDNATWNTISEGGHIIGGPLANIYFPSATTFRPLDYGQRTGTGGFSVGGDGAQLGLGQSISEDQKSNQFLVRASYDLSDSVTAYAMAMGSWAEFFHYGPHPFAFTTTIFSGNAFLPAAVQAQMTSTNTASFVLSKYLSHPDYLPGLDETFHYSLFAGLEGEFGDGYSWNLDFARGRTKHRGEGSNLQELRPYVAAVDAVRDPATNQIVCRVNLTNPGLYPGCVPYNVFGFRSASPEAEDYVRGESIYKDFTTLSQVSFSVQGAPLSLWAGPVAVAAGGEYRKYTLDVQSNADPGVVRPVTGLRGLDVGQPRFFFTNVSTAQGAVNVKEMFAEVAIPLANKLPLLEVLDVNGAVRVTDYSTSGTVTTWKAGGTWRPIPDILLRLTRSHDIRAPTVYDLYSSVRASRSGVFDPHTNVSTAIDVFGSGNPDLRPEIADNLSFGVALTPGFLPGLNLSADYYDISMQDAIATLGASPTLLVCEQSNGLDPICAQITRPFPFSDRRPENTVTAVRNVPSNQAFLDIRGVDFEVSYNTPLADGSLTARLLLTYLDKYRSQNSPIAVPIEDAGWGTHANAHPHLKGALSLTYSQDRFSLFLQERLIGGFKLGPAQVYAEPDVKAKYYTDITGTYTVNVLDGETDLFLTINNALNQRPPIIPGTTAPGFGVPTTPIYDTIGRTFTFGARMKF